LDNSRLNGGGVDVHRWTTMTDRVTKPNKECPFVDLSAFDAAALDLDGAIPQTASLHAAAWKQLFDSFLERRAARTGQAFQPFDIERDYREYVDGKPRHEGVVSFLASRGISLPEGRPEDPPDADTVLALGNQKNDLFHALLARRGVAVFEGSVTFLHKLREAGLKTAVVSASESTAGIVAAAGVSHLFDVRVDGIEAASKRLKGKPAPDTFLHAVRLLGTSPDRMLGVEDSMAGIEALSAAGFGLIIGIERRGQGRALIERGATLVVRDLADIRLSLKDRQWGVEATTGERRAQTFGMDLPASPTSDAAWTLVEEGFVLSREHEIESIFAIGNGFVGTRASLAEGSPLSAPATFLAGLFDQSPETMPGLVTLPDWTRLSVVLEGAPIRLDAGRNLEHRRILDMRQGILWREWRHEDAAGRITRFRGLRLASLADRRLLIQSVALSAENYSGTVSIDMGLGESVSRPTHRGLTVALAAATRLSGVESPERGGAMPSQSFEVELGKA
jgi:HAD superfamily hydrolase (TIGR01509 family)